MLEPFMPHPHKVPQQGCISLIGMAAAGKTTIGKELSTLTHWAHMDTDHIIEAFYGTKLQTLSTTLSKDEFLDVESTVIRSLNVQRTIVSTGGSVVYRAEAIAYLASLGPLIYIDVPLPIILKRIARKPDRGLAIAPGQTVEDLFAERQELYRKAATVTFVGDEGPPAVLAQNIVQWLIKA